MTCYYLIGYSDRQTIDGTKYKLNNIIDIYTSTQHGS